MSLVSIFDANQTQRAREWLEVQGELFVVARLAYTSGTKLYYLFDRFDAYQDVISTLKPRTDVCVFRDQQLPNRGLANAEMRELAASLWTPPDERMMVELHKNTALVEYIWEEDPQDFDDAFTTCSNKEVAFGPLPSWWLSDHDGMLSGLIPDTDGTLKRGAYWSQA